MNSAIEYCVPGIGVPGIPQEELAIRMGTSQSAIARLESGRTMPSTRTLRKLAEATGRKLRIVLEPDKAA